MGLSSVSYAQDKGNANPPPQGVRVNVAIIDMKHIRRNAAVIKDIRGQISKYRQAYQAEIKKEELELRNANQELARQRTILSPEAFAEERRKFEQRVVEVQRKVQNRRRELDSVQSKAIAQVQTELAKIITTFASEKNITLVFRKEQTVIVAKPLEITATILSRLDKSMPSLVVPAPGK